MVFNLEKEINYFPARNSKPWPQHWPQVPQMLCPVHPTPQHEVQEAPPEGDGALGWPERLLGPRLCPPTKQLFACQTGYLIHRRWADQELLCLPPQPKGRYLGGGGETVEGRNRRPKPVYSLFSSLAGALVNITPMEHHSYRFRTPS